MIRYYLCFSALSAGDLLSPKQPKGICLWPATVDMTWLLLLPLGVDLYPSFFFIKHDDWHFWYQFTVSPFSSEWLRGSYITVILQSSKLAKICRIGRKIRSKDLPFFLLVVRSKNYLLWMKSWNLAVPNPAIDSLLGQCICRWRKHGHMTSSQITSLGFWTELCKGPD